MTAATSTILGAASRGLDALSAGLNAFGTLSLFGLMLLVNADVVGRGLFSNPVSGAPEITRIAIVAIVYLQLSDALNAGRLTRSDFLQRLLAARPRMAAVLEMVIALTGLLLMALLAARFVPEIERAHASGRFYGTRGGVTIPLWPLNLIIAVGLTVTALQFLRGVLRSGAAILRGGGGRAL